MAAGDTEAGPAASSSSSSAGAAGPAALVIAGGYSPEVRFLDAGRGEVRRTLVLQDYGHVNCMAICPGAQKLAVAGNPHMRLYEIQESANSDPVEAFEAHRDNVTAVGFEETGRWAYTGSEDGTIRIWDCRSQKCQLCYENAGPFALTAIHSVDLHPNQVEIVAGDDSGKVLVWDIKKNSLRRTLIPEEGVPVRSVCIAPDARVVVCANHEGTCYVWRLSDGSFLPLQKIDAHGAYVLRCLFSPGASHLATTSADCTANVWRSESSGVEGEGLARCFTLTGHSEWVWDCAFASDGQYLLTGSSDCTCRLWDLHKGTQHSEFTGFSKGVTAVALIDAAKTCT